MKLRESGMPAQDYWETLFDVPAILDAFGFDSTTADVAELGCGYGTFTIPLAKRIAGRLIAVDFDPAMVATTQQRGLEAGLHNIHARIRDVVADGFCVPPASCDAALLFNILHAEEPVALLRAARDVVRPGGLVAVIHWRSDIATPRGPSLAIRPRPGQIAAWAAEAGLTAGDEDFALPPWHFGIKLHRAPGR
ncbi:MAG: class I SAM-dependent methyltransferase [Opitutaceae bacterium]|nr:class I SAM-dependent methyltransferase [Opitutaceae bacterium]